MPSRFALALLAFALILVPHAALATYNEWHLTGSDVRIVVDRDAKAVVEQHVALRVVAGSLRSLSLPGYPADAVFEPEGKVTADDGRTFALSVGRDGDAFAQAITQDALKRGDYTFELRYRIDLREGRIAADGALSRISFVAPPLAEGVDGARVVFDLPAAPTEPRLAADGQTGVLATLRRTADRDELELVRPHVPRGESITWAVRVDPASISAHTTPTKEAAAAPISAPRDRVPFIAAAVGALYAVLWSLKRRAFAAGGARVVGLPSWLGFVLLSLGVAIAVIERSLGRPVVAGALVAVVAMLAVLRARRVSRSRGPGQWVALRAREVFGARSSLSRSSTTGDLLDARTASGRRVLASLVAVIAAVSWWLSRRGCEWDLPWLLAFALVPIFVTGTRAELGPDTDRQTSVLRAIYMRLSASAGLKVTPWARLPAHADRPDEVRLLVVPRAPIPGLFGVEVATTWERRAGTFVAGTEVLVRVHEDSPASAKMSNTGAAAHPGRKPEERVFRFAPEWPTNGETVSLAREWAERLVDRRVQGACIWVGAPERRAPAVA